MKVTRILAAFVLVSSSSAAIAAMNAEDFYQRAVKLDKQGAAAIFSKDLKPLAREVKSSGYALRSENKAAMARGKPYYCPPKNSKRMGRKEFISSFRALGAKRKTMTVKQALKSIMIKKYPCR